MRARPARSRTTRTLVAFAGFVVVLIAVGAVVERGSEPSRGPVDTQHRPPVVVGEVGTCGGRPTAAPRELRGMWLTTVNNIDWPSRPGLDVETVKAEYRDWLDLAQRLNHNAIFVHVRPSGDAFWPSQYAPWSEWLTGRRDGLSPGWDPLEWMVAETHGRNLEFHAWFNPYRGGQPAPLGPGGDAGQLAPNHPLRAHPEWAVVYPVGTNGSRFYFDPGNPQARRFVEDSMLEAVARYDIDGVDFDDFFYPYPEAGQDFGDARSFAAYGQNFASKSDWRRDNVNTFVREMSERIKAVKPWVKFGISPFGIWRNSATDPSGSATRGLQSYDEIYADARTWIKQRWVDYIMPQLYWQIGFERADYAILLPWWSGLVAGTGVQLYIAHADYRVGEAGAWQDPAELDRQIALDRQHHVDGSVHFSAKSVRDDALGAVTRYRTTHYSNPALVPTMAHLPATAPATPVLTAVQPDPDGPVTVIWRPGNGTAATAYAIYRLDAGRANSRLVGAVRSTGGAEQSLVDRDPAAVPQSQYCVSGLDRSWNEGRVSQPMGVP
ncbi:MAG: hypothetical protein QOE61_2526 [Micromonosporaceae bacterium]|jgi:uncharacterized lipoprotein YddW (UPF0748 family)|nr:hypothetical protein [Micromonosporaceae bacterium]